MSQRNRRKKFLIHKPLQLHYLFYFVSVLLTVSAVGLTGHYFGVWAKALQIFSPAEVQNTLTTAAQISEYEQARRPYPHRKTSASLRSFREIDLLSAREQEIVQNVLLDTSLRIAVLGVLVIILIGWGTIYLTHKVAGPIFKLKQYCHALASGDLTVRLRFRKFDEAQDVAPHFNEMAANLDTSIGNIKNAVRNLPSDTAKKEIEKELSRFKTTKK
jgi:methyl-accepting chemotaxis protein